MPWPLIPSQCVGRDAPSRARPPPRHLPRPGPRRGAQPLLETPHRVHPGGSGKQPPRAWRSVREKQPPPGSPAPYDVGGCLPLLGQELGIVNDLLQKADHSEFQLLVGFKVLPSRHGPSVNERYRQHRQFPAAPLPARSNPAETRAPRCRRGRLLGRGCLSPAAPSKREPAGRHRARFAPVHQCIGVTRHGRGTGASQCQPVGHCSQRPQQPAAKRDGDSKESHPVSCARAQPEPPSRSPAQLLRWQPAPRGRPRLPVPSLAHGLCATRAGPRPAPALPTPLLRSFHLFPTSTHLLN